LLVSGFVASVLAYFESLYWGSIDPFGPGELVSNLGLCAARFLIISSAILLVGPERISAWIWTLVWPGDDAEWPKRLRAVRTSRSFRKVRKGLLSAVVVTLALYCVSVTARLLGDTALLATGDTTKTLAGSLGMHCRAGQTDISVCRGSLAADQRAKLRAVDSYNDAFGRQFVTLRDKNMPVLSNLSAETLSKIADALLFTSDHPDGKMNRDVLAELAIQISNTEPISSIVQLSPSERYSQGSIDIVAIVHYALWAEVSYIETLPQLERQDQWRELEDRAWGKTSTEAIWTDLERYALGVAEVPDACRELLRKTDVLRFAYLRAYASMVFESNVIRAERFLEVAVSLLDRGCIPTQTKGFWYAWNLCLYGRNTRLASQRVCKSMRLYAPTAHVFPHHCKKLYVLKDVLDEIDSKGFLSCSNGMQDYN
jgi:hypothetical protein